MAEMAHCEDPQVVWKNLLNEHSTVTRTLSLTYLKWWPFHDILIRLIHGMLLSKVPLSPDQIEDMHPYTAFEATCSSVMSLMSCLDQLPVW